MTATYADRQAEIAALREQADALEEELILDALEQSRGRELTASHLLGWDRSRLARYVLSHPAIAVHLSDVRAAHGYSGVGAPKRAVTDPHDLTAAATPGD